MREVRFALVAGLALVGVAIGVALSRSPLSLARTNVTSTAEERIAYVHHGTGDFCQAGELLPAGTTAIRLWMFAFAGPQLRVSVFSKGHAITGGERGSGWTSRAVAVPVRPLARTVADVTVCVSFTLRDEELTVFGTTTRPAIAAHDGRAPLAGRMSIEYLRPGTRSWASLVGPILGRMGLGRASSGAGIVGIAVALLAGVAALASGLVLRELR